MSLLPSSKSHSSTSAFDEEIESPSHRFWQLLLAKWAAASFDPPQTVHVAFMTLKPLFFMVRGNMEEESHGEEKEEEERENEDLKRARTDKCFGLRKRLNEVRPLCFSGTICCCQARSATPFRRRIHR
jgi:hypothetical protein